jgi:hypothetical protein
MSQIQSPKLAEVITKWESARQELDDVILHLKAGVIKEDEYYGLRKDLMHTKIGKVASRNFLDL